MAFVALDFSASSGNEKSLFCDLGDAIQAKWTHKNLLVGGSRKEIQVLEVTSDDVRDNKRGQFLNI